MTRIMTRPTFFETPADFRVWLEEHHGSAEVLWVGYYKKSSGRSSITWPESVDEALCFGWIDGLRKSVDDISYKIRFTPRKPDSKWSAVNIARVEELLKNGRMRPAGIAAYERRLEKNSRVYSYEQRKKAALDPGAEERFRAHPEAWKFFRSQPPGYRRTAIYWVVSAKREDTRRRRLDTLIEDSANGLRIGPLRRGS
jgi:uncharacterized protein YdeI (YjbR/CyaY-like superfamily)